MGARGPSPTPTKLKLLRGNPGRRPLNQQEPKPELRIPSCPAELPAAAKKEWRRVAKELAAVGLISRIDRAGLAAYCQNYARWIAAEEAVQKTGVVIRLPDSNIPILSPYLKVAETALKHMMRALAEFGMTPASRSRIQAQPPSKTDAETEKARRYFGR